jgi:hypothetical protein
LRFILECIEKNKLNYKTDELYLESLTEQLEDEINKLQGSTVRITKSKGNISRALILDKILDKIIDKQNSKAAGSFTYVRKKKSFLSRLFSR